MLKRDPARSKTLEDFEKRFKSFFDRLIPFPEIADWYSDLRRNTTSKEAGLAEAFEMLKCDLLAGDFEENGRSLVRFLYPGVTKTRMTRSWLLNAIEHNYDNELAQTYLEHCWLPREPFRCWLAKHELPTSPNRFFRTERHEQVHAAQNSKLGSGAKTQGITGAIKILFPNGIPAGLSAKDRNNRILTWLRENDCSIPNDLALARAIQRALKSCQSK